MLRHVGRNNPLVMVFAGLCCGILAAHHDGHGLVFGLVLTALLISRKRILHTLIGISLGMAAFTLGPAWEDVAEGNYQVSGMVTCIEYAHGTLRAVLRDVTVGGRRIRGKMLFNIYENNAGIRSGSRISCYARIREPWRYGNSGEFNYQQYLLTRNIVLTGSVQSGSEIAIVGRSESTGLKDELIRLLNRYSRPEAEVIKAIALGERSGITHSLRDRFNSLGIAHLMAISGLHIGITLMIGYGVVFWVLRIMPPLALRVDSPFISRLGGIGAALSYTFFVGPEVTVLRACIMAITCVAGLFLLRKYDLIGGLSFAGILILMFWPMALYGASFQLSFCAVLGIGGVLEKSQGSPAWLRWLLITPAAGVFTIPLVMYLFGFVSSAGLLANIIIVPFFGTIIMPLSILGILIHPIHPALCGPVFVLDMKAIRLLLRACDFFGALHPVSTPWITWVFTCYIGLIVAFWGDRTRLRTIILTGISAALFMFPIIRHVLECSTPMRFDFISVGQGDCSLITQGSHAVLIDAGPAHGVFDAGRYIVSPHLLRRGCTSLDLVIITHLHPDHCGGMPFVLERFSVGQVWINAPMEKNTYFQEVMRITKEKSIPLKYVCRGDSLRIGTMTMQVLNPQQKLNGHGGRMDQNLQSIVLTVHDNQTKGLFMGDADMFGELILVHLQEDISADILKVAHHGGRKSCLGPFLDAVNPDVAVISCGHKNAYGTPAYSTLHRLKKHGIRIYRTDMHGEILITSQPGGTTVKSVLIPADIQ